MDDSSIRRLRDSSVAAALNAMTSETDADPQAPEELLPLVTHDDTATWLIAHDASGPSRLVFDACRELALAGIRPRSKVVMAFLKDRHGATPPRTQVSPLVKKWRAGQWKSDAVRNAFQAYALLDAEQRIAFRMRADVDDDMLSYTTINNGTEDAQFEIRIYYGGSRTMSHRADRATTAWIKLQNLIDRRHPDAVRIELIEYSSKGPRVLKQWTPSPTDISSWP